MDGSENAAYPCLAIPLPPGDCMHIQAMEGLNMQQGSERSPFLTRVRDVVCTKQ